MALYHVEGSVRSPLKTRVFRDSEVFTSSLRTEFHLEGVDGPYTIVGIVLGCGIWPPKLMVHLKLKDYISNDSNIFFG